METVGSQSTRPSLLVRIRDPRDVASWQAFVDAYTRLIYGYCRRTGLQDADAADVTQEVLFEVARCIRAFEYEPQRGRFRDWLGLLTRRRAIRFLKDKNRMAGGGAGELGDDESSWQAAHVDPEWIQEFHTHILKAAMERARPHFEPVTWRAFELVWLENRSSAEVAAELMIPIETVYVAKSRVLKRLEEEIRILAEDVPQLVPLK
jgi:RNA polymerase sigma factor (sigma-70 family)